MSSWLTGMCHKTVSPISRDNLRACGLVRFNAAALASLRRSRRRAYELLRIQIKLLFAPGAAEVIRLPVVLGSSSGNSRFEVHTALNEASPVVSVCPDSARWRSPRGHDTTLPSVLPTRQNLSRQLMRSSWYSSSPIERRDRADLSLEQ